MISTKHNQLLDIYEKAIQAVHPKNCLKPYLPEPPETGRIIVLGAGKAAAAMVCTLENHYQEQNQAKHLSGTAVTRHGYNLKTQYIPVIQAGHPIPDGNSCQAAKQALQWAKDAKAEDLVIVLLSGGASALWSLPHPALTLKEKQDITQQLLKSGAPIKDINCVRKHLSQIKGGRLALAATPAHLITLAISDVPGNDPASIGSGPTQADPTNCTDALKIIQTYNINISSEIKSLLASDKQESPNPKDPFFQSTQYQLIATPMIALQAAAQYIQQLGYTPHILADNLEGEAQILAKEHAHLALKIKTQAKAKNQPIALLSAGEVTVTVKGNGQGGPNQEYALMLAHTLKDAQGIWALAADTDGTDGGSGAPNDPAGAIVTPTTLKRAHKNNLNPAIFLKNNDSTSFFAKLNDLVIRGPTQTNVNDFRVILIDP